MPYILPNIEYLFLSFRLSSLYIISQEDPLNPPPKVMKIKKTKINKWDLIKLKSFCTVKETISKVKRQPSEWEKIVANKATDKESQKYTSSS